MLAGELGSISNSKTLENGLLPENLKSGMLCKLQVVSHNLKYLVWGGFKLVIS